VTGPPKTAERSLRADARRNRERILDSARVVFAQHGVDAQMDDVASRAGVGVGTVYRHFPTKDALMAELVRQKLCRISAISREALELEGEPFEIFADVLRRGAAVTAKDAALQFSLMGAGEHIWAQAAAERQELIELTSELMARAQRAGTMRTDVSAEDVPILMGGVCATMAHTGPGVDWRRHLELVIDSLRPRQR
jgi:AcrR family transcriptional regulator